MTTQTVYNIAIITHIIGFTMIAGAILVDYVITKQFWKQYGNDKQNASPINQPMSVFSMLFSLGIYIPILFGIGMLLLIISGVAQIILTQNVFFEQYWLQIKLGLVIIVIINGLAVGKRQGKKLKTLLIEEASGKNVEAKLSLVKNNIHWFHFTQMVLLIGIFVLSVFKFN